MALDSMDWLQEQTKLIKEEIDRRQRLDNSHYLKKASYFATLLLEYLYNEETRLSGEEIIGME